MPTLSEAMLRQLVLDGTVSPAGLQRIASMLDDPEEARIVARLLADAEIDPVIHAA